MACVVDESDLSTAQPFCPANPSVHRGITDHLSRVYFTICNVEGLTQTGLCLFNSLLLCPPFLWELWSLSLSPSLSLSLLLSLSRSSSRSRSLSHSLFEETENFPGSSIKWIWVWSGHSNASHSLDAVSSVKWNGPVINHELLVDQGASFIILNHLSHWLIHH